VFGMSRILVGCALAVATMLSGCASNGEISTYEELGPEANTKGFGDLYPADRIDNDFTFGLGDVVLVQTENEPLLTGPFTVRIDGKITLPTIGDIMVAGLTTEQVKRKLENKVAVYLKEVIVTIGVGQIQSKKYYIAAQNPATGGFAVAEVAYPGNVTLFDVWVRMGSPSTLLDDECHMKVLRCDPRNPDVKTINIREMLVSGYSGGNIQIRPNDIVYVPPTLWGRVNAFVQGVTVPLNGLFRVTNTIGQVDRTVRIIEGDDTLYGGGYYGGGFD
jgi:hypothetical protein